jgi:hypothetical protein
MKTVIDPSQYNAMLAKWRGASARIWIFDVSLTRLGIRLSKLDEPEVLYIVGVSCEHIVGPFSWQESEVSIAVKSESGESFDLLFDKKAGFALRCLGIVMVRGSATDLDKTFANFLGDGPTDPSDTLNATTAQR